MPKATLSREVDKKFNHTNNVNKKVIKKKRTRPTKVNKPKKPRNAWQIFYTAKRPWMVEFLKNKARNSQEIDDIDGDNTTIRSSVVMKALSSVWRGLTPSDKLHYERLSIEESKKYFEKMKEINGDDKPSRPKTVFLLFVDEYRDVIAKELNIHHMNDIITACSKKWRQLSNSDKEKYHVEYKRRMDLYNQELVDFTDKNRIIYDDNDDDRTRNEIDD